MQLNSKHNRSFRLAAIAAFIAYLCILVYLTVVQRLLRGTVTGLFLENYTLDWNSYLTYSVNLIPFKTITEYLFNPPNAETALTNLAGNIIAFIPFGFLAPVVFKRVNNFKTMFVISAAVSALIEIIQMLLKVGSTDIDDTILNTLGGLIGFSLLILVLKASRKWFGDRDVQESD